MSFATGYCTNVHAGANLSQTMENLQQHATAVRQQFCPDRPMGIGLWLSSSTANALAGEASEIAKFAKFLETNQLVPYTMNGFPFGDFHQERVKHDVYLPTWMESDRAHYTRTLIELLDAILPDGAPGSISTVPIAWGKPPLTDDQWRQAAKEMLTVVDQLQQLEDRRGRFICLCIEPEPGCAIQTSDGLVEFFERYLFKGAAAERVQRYLQVCHDVCHANVMFEPQEEVLDRYADYGLGIGKVQVSSAVVARFDDVAVEQREAMLRQLADFGEDRYLHQTCVRRDGRVEFFEDLPIAIDQARANGGPAGEWRVHFHVPVYLEAFGHLRTSRDDVETVLRHLPPETHFEVETYAWNVLPSELRCDTLAEGIARELAWFEQIRRPT